MRKLCLFVLTLAIAACSSSSTAPSATRYNFAVIDGRNQISTAGDATLQRSITSELTRDPQGQFATRVFDFFAPAVAYAQTLTLSGTPVANAIVCGREAKPGEPQVIPLCAFTLADGKAANSVKGGTKAGTYNILFTAQVTAQQPVADSTTVTVIPGPADANFRIIGAILFSPAVLPADAVRDAFANAVPFRVVGDANITVSDTTTGSVGARTLTFIESTNPNGGTSAIVELRGAGNILVGHLRYHIAPPGSYALPAIDWVSAGTALTP
jgi:hypothetical protein